jgi:prepilin-type N-terminal cleavage/methylation domain-containing protein
MTQARQINGPQRRGIAGRPLPWPPRGFSLLEIILVLVLIGIAAAIVLPSVTVALSDFHMEQAAHDLQSRLAHIRLQAMEQGVPYAFTYRPETDQYLSWACEPLTLGLGYAPAHLRSAAGDAAPADAYDRRHFELNDRADNREFRFLAPDAAEVLGAMGLSAEARYRMGNQVSGELVASSTLLSRHKLGLVTASARSTAALQIPGLERGDVADPIVFEPDGTADRDAIIRVADRTGRYVEVSVQALTGAILASSARLVTDLVGAEPSAIRTTTQPSRGTVGMPSRSREIQR